MIESTAWAATRTDSVRVQATSGGVPTAVHIDSRELRFGGTELARTIMEVHARATQSAMARHRTRLERDGMAADILDRLGLPRASTVADTENELLGIEAAPVSWMKSL